MSAYLKFFELEQSPFESRSQSKVVLGTRALRDAFAAISAGLEEGASRICVGGGPGLGKTTLARALPRLLGDRARVAMIADPTPAWASLRQPIARQWGLGSEGLARGALVEASRRRRLVLVIDRAERASEEFLDHLDVLLSHRTEQDEPVVQSVLLARLSGDAEHGAARPTPLLWWLDRIQTLQLTFAPLAPGGVEPYVARHLARAGWQGGDLFTPAACRAIHEYTGGIPGEVSALCERLLTTAAAADLREIDEAFVRALCEPEGPTTGEQPTDARGDVAEASHRRHQTATDALAAAMVAELIEARSRDRHDAGPSGSEPVATPSDDPAPPQRAGFANEDPEPTQRMPVAAPQAEIVLDEEIESTAAPGWEATAEVEPPGWEATAEVEPPGCEATAEVEPPGWEAPADAAASDRGDDPIGAAFARARAQEDPTPAAALAGESSPTGPILEEEDAFDAFVPPSPLRAVDAHEHQHDEELAALEAYLSSPPTPEELRAIRGGWLRRNVRPFLAAAAAAILGGVGLARLAAERPAPTAPETAGPRALPTAAAPSPPPRALRLDPEKGSPAVLGQLAPGAPPTVIARIRGPVAAGAREGTGTTARAGSGASGSIPAQRSARPVGRTPLEDLALRGGSPLRRVEDEAPPAAAGGMPTLRDEASDEPAAGL